MNPGRYIGFKPSPTTTSAPGVWMLEESIKYRAAGKWPVAGDSTPAWEPSSSVVLLMHFNGTNYDTSTTDSSLYDHPVTMHPNAVINTLQSKFGGSSLLLDGASGSRVSVAAQFGLAQQAFTVDCWVRLDEANSGDFPMVCEIGDNRDDGIAMGLTLGNPGEHQTWHPSVWGNRAADVGWGVAVTPGQWTHLAWSADAEYVRMYVDGVEAGAAAVNSEASLTATSNAVTVGGTATSRLYSWGWDDYGVFNPGVNVLFAGHIDELRVVRGVSDFPSAFTTPEFEYLQT
jgi:hypothetical protein